VLDDVGFGQRLQRFAPACSHRPSRRHDQQARQRIAVERGERIAEAALAQLFEALLRRTQFDLARRRGAPSIPRPAPWRGPRDIGLEEQADLARLLYVAGKTFDVPQRGPQSQRQGQRHPPSRRW
jgi:hypothetical protein